MFGGALVLIVISWVNVLANRHKMEKEGLETFLTMGANLSDFAYTFIPPWTVPEVVILATGVVGLVLKGVADKLP
jgi:hypothetical protein